MCTQKQCVYCHCVATLSAHRHMVYFIFFAVPGKNSVLTTVFLMIVAFKKKAQNLPWESSILGACLK